jgi:hypothetical protein
MTSGDGQAMLLTGPTPASLDSLDPGSSQDFVYTYKATVPGPLTFQGELQATQSDNSQTTAMATCSLGAAKANPRAAARTDPPGDVCKEPKVTINGCKLEDISQPLEVDRLTGDSTPAPGTPGYQHPGGT